MSIEKNITNKEKILTKEKPKFLYHGSPDRGLIELKPQSRTQRAEKLLYATPDMAIASTFLIKGVHYGCGKFGDVPYAWILADRDDFIRQDKGGHIYVSSGDSFVMNPDSGLANDEYISVQPVQPSKTIKYQSAVDAMMENGVQVYFINQPTYNRLQSAKDHGYTIFATLESENQRRGINVKPFAEQGEA
jgi:hypothetical protein